ncbi:MAG: pitrilysin family protein [Candidatus Omnitrophota bacterium]
MYKKTILNNGLRVIAHPMPKMQSLALGIWLKVGARYESADQSGISHFLEHLLFKGTKKYSCRKIKESIEGVGGSLNGFTSEELTCYLVKIPADYLSLALNILSDMVLDPLLSPSEIQREKTVILEEIKMYRDLPQSHVYELLDELLWPDQPLGAPIIGSAEIVSRISRKELFLFKQRYYTPCNIVISAAGLLDYNELLGGVKRIFCANKNHDQVSFEKAREGQNKPRLKIYNKKTEQTHMALGFHGFSRDHYSKHAQSLLHVILGANMSSRLFNQIREKEGLAYEIGTLVKRYQDTGAFVVHAGMDNRKVLDAIRLVLKELRRIKKALVSEDEFKRAKDFYLGQTKLALEDTLNHMLWIGETSATLDRAYSLSDIIKEVNKVTREDLREVAQYIFQEKRLNLALIGPLRMSEDKLKQQLGLIS